jgi:TolA-binding protein
MKKNIFLGLFLIICVGCGRISPISPELDQRLNNTDGKIDEIRNNQNGLMLELGKINQQQEIIGRDIEITQDSAKMASEEKISIDDITQRILKALVPEIAE